LCREKRLIMDWQILTPKTLIGNWFRVSRSVRGLILWPRLTQRRIKKTSGQFRHIGAVPPVVIFYIFFTGNQSRVGRFFNRRQFKKHSPFGVIKSKNPSTTLFTDSNVSAFRYQGNTLKASAFHWIRGDCVKKKPGTYWSALVTAHLQ